MKAYIGILAAFANALAASWIYWFGLVVEPRFLIGATLFAGFILLSDLFSVQVTERSAIGCWAIVLILAVITLGPIWAALAYIPYALYVGRRDLLRNIYEISHGTIIACLAGIVFSFASEPLLSNDPASLAVVLYGTLLSGAMLTVSSEAISGTLLKVKYDQPFREVWKDTVRPYLLSNALDVLTAGLGALSLVVYGPIAAIVVIAGFLGSLTLVYRSREHVKENRELRARIDSLEEALTTSNTIFGTMIVRDLGRRDGYTHRHAVATSAYAADLAGELKMDGAKVERLRMAGLLHNIGLFSLPEDLLLATGRLNSIAQSQLAEHPVRGEQALAAVPEFREMASWVRWHHERIDGRGYPDKLREAWIPIEAKVLAVAQGYAAMVLDQPRRPGMAPAAARECLVAEINRQFDGTIVRAFLRILDTESEGYRMADDHRFLFPDTARASMTQERLQTGSGTLL